jgi:hypothetical protein
VAEPVFAGQIVPVCPLFQSLNIPSADQAENFNLYPYSERRSVMTTTEKLPENPMKSSMSPEDLAGKINILRQMFGTTLHQETKPGMSENQIFNDEWHSMEKN